MAEFTLLKLQFEEASFTANAPYSGADESDSENDDETDDTDEEDGGRLFALLVGFAFLLVVAVAVRKLRRGSGESESGDVSEV